MTKDYHFTVSIRSDGSHCIVGCNGMPTNPAKKSAPTPGHNDPLRVAIQNELQAVTGELCRKIRTGDYVGGYTEVANGVWMREDDVLGSEKVDGPIQVGGSWAD